MVIRLPVMRVAGLVFAGTGVLASGQAFAQANVLKECGTQYQAAKAANELGGQGWQDFLKSCRARLKEAAPAAEAKPAETKPAETAKPVEPKPSEATPAQPKPAAAEAKPAEAAPAAEAPAANPLKPAAAESAAPVKETQQSTRSRQKKCAAEWKANKKALLKDNAKLTWPKYWSECNKKLKEAGE